MIEYLKKKLNILNPEYIEIFNQSHLHIGHSGYSDNNSHFKLLIVSDKFSNLSRIERHKIIYEILENELKSKIHALSIEAFTEKEYKN